MSQTFDLQSLLWLIHSEISSAVYAVKSEPAPLEMQQVRVRMGQASDETSEDSSSVSLPSDRYPAAEQGWLVDVVYDATQNQLPSSNLNSTENEVTPNEWLGVSGNVSVEFLEGVGQKRLALLEALGVKTLADLSEYDVSASSSQQSLVRRLRTLARLGLQLPPVAIPQELIVERVFDLIEKPGLLEASGLSREGQGFLMQWLLNLEICFDDTWLQSHTLKQIIYIS
jgi:hypothetical protein